MVCSADPSRAEWFIDVYGAIGFVNNDDISTTRATATEDISVTAIDATLKNVEIDDLLTGGLRFGYWFDTTAVLGLDIGLGLDAFYFPLAAPSQTVRTASNVDIEISVAGERFVIPAGEDQDVRLPSIDADDTAVVAPELLLLRPFLTTSAFPHGRLQPYLTIAPALLISDTDPEITVGIKIGAGLQWWFHKHLALLAEYRFTHFALTINDSNLLVENVIIRRPDIEVDLLTRFIVAGLSLRF